MGCLVHIGARFSLTTIKGYLHLNPAYRHGLLALTSLQILNSLHSNSKYERVGASLPCMRSVRWLVGAWMAWERCSCINLDHNIWYQSSRSWDFAATSETLWHFRYNYFSTTFQKERIGGYL